MKLGIVRTILRKELLETFRDKRTLIAMVGIPLLLYPVLIIAVTQALSVQQSRIAEKESQVAIAGGAGELRGFIEAIPKVRVVEPPDPQEALRNGQLDAVVVLEAGAAQALTQNASAEVRVQFDRTEAASREALSRIRQGLRKNADRLLAQRLAKAGLKEDFIRPIRVTEENVAPPEKQTGWFLGKVLPLVVIMMLGVGAFYPAVDLTAGEKERGTFETLLSTPISKTEIVCGKFLTVCCISILTALLNLGSMVLSLWYQLSRMASELPKGAGGFDLSLVQISPLNVALIFAVLVPMALLICSMMMSIALFARTFKEAQNFVTPFFLLIILPAMLAVLPGMELSRGTMFIPVTNVALLFRDLLMGKARAEAVFGVLLSTTVFAMLALVAAVWLFQREEVILSEEKGFPLTLRRSAFVPRKTPTPGASLMLFALALLGLFYVGSYVQLWNLIPGLLITEWGVLLLPTVGVLWYVRVDLREALRLRPPAPAALAATVLVAAGMCVWTWQIGIWQNRVLPMPQELARPMERLMDYGGTPAGLAILLFTVAVSPAVCEEVLFRGAILSGIRSRLSPAASVLIVGLLFGLFHLSVYRIVPTALLGVAITYVVLRAGSIFPGMLLHFLNNATAIVVFSRLLPGSIRGWVDKALVQEAGFSWWVLLGAAAVLAAGVTVLELARKRGEEVDCG